MKRFLYLTGGMLLLLGLMSGPALAKVVHKGTLECVNPDASGKAKINTKGDLKIKAEGLEPSTDHVCEVLCACEESDNESGNIEPGHVIFEEICTTDEDGKLKFSAKGAVAGESCDCPVVEVEEFLLGGEGEVDCRSGFDL
jgi:hypothetical protein